MIKFGNKYYPINFLPYIFSFILEQIQVKYVYLNDNIYFYQDYLYDIKILPPIMKFKIDDKDVSSSIKNYKECTNNLLFVQL